MFGNANLDELWRLWRQVTTNEGDAGTGSLLGEALPGLIDEITRLRTENERLRDGLGEVRQLLEVSPRALGARLTSPVGLL